jgi:Plasmid encoded RepA protein
MWDEEQGGEGWNRGAIVASGLRFNAVEPDGQGCLWQDRVVLDRDFYEALRRHPIPLREAATRELRDRSMSIDLYVWLAFRLHSLAGPTRISWVGIHGQFGSGYAELRHFRPRFAEALAAAVAAYPEARVDLGEDGLGAQIAAGDFDEAWDGGMGPASPVFWMTDALQGQ